MGWKDYLLAGMLASGIIGFPISLYTFQKLQGERDSLGKAKAVFNLEQKVRACIDDLAKGGTKKEKCAELVRKYSDSRTPEAVAEIGRSKKIDNQLGYLKYPLAFTELALCAGGLMLYYRLRKPHHH